jgi:hypothetical protein
VGTLKQTAWTLFNPISDFYGLLECGDEGALQSAMTDIARHLELPQHPFVHYEWGLKMEPTVAGQIKVQRYGQSIVRIPLSFVGRPHALGCILSHELTHERLAYTDIQGADRTETELLTDLMSIALGLGKLMMNGLIVMGEPLMHESRILGYLEPELCVYAYKFVNRYFAVPESASRDSLTEEALQRLREWA